MATAKTISIKILKQKKTPPLFFSKGKQLKNKKDSLLTSTQVQSKTTVKN